MKTIKYSLFGILLMMASCEEEDFNSSLIEFQEELAKYYMDAEAALSNVYNIVDLTMRNDNLTPADTGQMYGANVYQDGNTTYIDYGNGAAGPDGITRSGLIKVEQTGDYEQSGGSLMVTFQDYVVDEKDVKGSFDVTNNGEDTLSMIVTGFSIGNQFSLNSTKSLAWADGFGTDTETDDEYYLNGQSTGTDPDNNSVTADITQSLLLDRDCEHTLVSGIIDLGFDMDTSSTSPTGQLDFVGDDGCQNIVNVSLQDGEQEVELALQFEGF